MQISRVSNDTTNRLVGAANVVSVECTALYAVRAVENEIVTSLQRLERKKLPFRWRDLNQTALHPFPRLDQLLRAPQSHVEL
jgi:hypothetical protein